MWHAVKHRRTAATAPEGDVPLLVRVLAGNPVTGAHILACLNTDDATGLRCLHPAVACAVAAVPWCDTGTEVVDPVRWRTCFPAAVGASLTYRAIRGLLESEPAAAAMGGTTHMDLCGYRSVTDDLLLRLPTSLHTLDVGWCYSLTGDASFAHLTALTSLDCRETAVLSRRADGLPPSLQVLDIRWTRSLADSMSLAHLRQLRVLRANCVLSNDTLALLPPSLEELHAAHSKELTPWASFAHLTALRMLDLAYCHIGDASLASVPSCLVSLNVRGCVQLTSAAILPHRSALQVLDVSQNRHWGCAGGQLASYPG